MRGGHSVGLLGWVLAVGVIGAAGLNVRVIWRPDRMRRDFRVALFLAVTLVLIAVTAAFVASGDAGYWGGLSADQRTDVHLAVCSADLLLVCLSLYQALIVWNRQQQGGGPGPGDWLNGVSAALVAAALGSAVVHTPASATAIAVLRVQLGVLCVGACVTVAGTYVTLMFLAHLNRDRSYACIGGVVLLNLLNSLLLAGHTWQPLVLRGLLAGSAVLLTLAVRSPVSDVIPQVATAAATSNGSLTVSVVGVLVLITGAYGHGSGWTIGYAAAGVLLVSSRLVHLVHDLEGLAATRKQALTDDLTGAGNRRFLWAWLETALAGRGGVGECRQVIWPQRLHECWPQWWWSGGLLAAGGGLAGA